MNPTPRGAAADDKESIAPRPSFFGGTAIPSYAFGLVFSSELSVLCVSALSFCRFRSCFLTSSLPYSSPLLNFPHALSASGPAPGQHPPPPHQIPRPRLRPRSTHQSLRRPSPRSRLVSLL